MKFFIIFTFLSFSLSLPIMAGTLPSVSLQTPIVGIDYPTDVPTHHAGKVLVIQNERVLVPISSQLVKSEAGTDYATDFPVSDLVRNSKVLVINEELRLPVYIEQAKPGIDFPTDGPPSLDREFSVWG